MKKGINYWAFPGGMDGTKDIGEFLREAKTAGFEAVELCIGEKGFLTPSSDEKQVRAIAADAERLGLEIASVASGMLWKYSLTSDDPARHEKAGGHGRDPGVDRVLLQEEDVGVVLLPRRNRRDEPKLVAGGGRGQQDGKRSRHAQGPLQDPLTGQRPRPPS